MFGHLKIVMKCIFLFILWVLFLPVSHFFSLFLLCSLEIVLQKMPTHLQTSHGSRTINLWRLMGKVSVHHPFCCLWVIKKYIWHLWILHTQMVLFSLTGTVAVNYSAVMNCAALSWRRGSWLCAVFWSLHIFFLVRVFRQCLFVFCLGISIKVSVVVESSTGLSTTTSTLEYSAMKEDTGARFKCRADGLPLESSSMNFTITCESLSVLCLKPFILISFFCL